MRTTVSVRTKLRAGAAARSRSSAWAASATAASAALLHPRRARPCGTGLTTPNAIAAEIGPSSNPRKIALRPLSVRAAAAAAEDTPRRRGSRNPCGSVVRTPPKAGPVLPRDDLRRLGVDKPVIIYERACGFHEVLLRECSLLFRGSLFFSTVIRFIDSLFPSADPRFCVSDFLQR